MQPQARSLRSESSHWLTGGGIGTASGQKRQVRASLVALTGESACNVGDPGLIPGLVRSPGERNGNPLQYSCLGKFHRCKSLEVYSPWGCNQLDMTEQLTHTGQKTTDSYCSYPKFSSLKNKNKIKFSDHYMLLVNFQSTEMIVVVKFYPALKLLFKGVILPAFLLLIRSQKSCPFL